MNDQKKRNEQLSFEQQLAVKGLFVLQHFSDNVVLAYQIDEQNQSNAIIVLKFSSDEDKLKMEYDITKKMVHKYIIPCGKFFSVGKKAVFEMKYASHVDLRTFLEQSKKQTGKIKLTFAKQFFWELIVAIRHVHRHGMMHGDIKLENLLLHHNSQECEQKSKFQLFLGDFGSAVPISYKGQVFTTSINQPPEELWTPASDIYQVGIVLFQLLTGRHPFENIESRSNFTIHVSINTIFNDQIKCNKLVLKGQELTIDLLNRMLNSNPQARPTIDEIYENHILRAFFGAAQIENTTVIFIEPPPNTMTTNLNITSVAPYHNFLVEYELLKNPSTHNHIIACLAIKRQQNGASKKPKIIQTVNIQYLASNYDLEYTGTTLYNQLLCNSPFVSVINKIWVSNNLLFVLYEFQNNAQRLNKFIPSQMSKNIYYSEKQRQVLLFQIAQGISIIHSRGLSFNNLKLSSIIKEKFNSKIFKIANPDKDNLFHYKLSDFLYCTKEKQLPESVLSTQIDGNDVAFLSPQQFFSFRVASQSNDIWALGILAYYLMHYQYPKFSTYATDETDALNQFITQNSKNIDDMTLKIIDLCLNHHQKTKIQDILVLPSVVNVRNMFFNNEALLANAMIEVPIFPTVLTVKRQDLYEAKVVVPNITSPDLTSEQLSAE